MGRMNDLAITLQEMTTEELQLRLTKIPEEDPISERKFIKSILVTRKCEVEIRSSILRKRAYR